MDDLISREATIDAVENLVVSMSVCINVDEYNGMRDMKYRALKAINELPSAQPELAQNLHNACTDLISRRRAIVALSHNKVNDDDVDIVIQKDIETLKLLPSAQPDLDSAYTEGYTSAESKYRKMWDEMPKIIRCKDCKHADEYCQCSYTTWWNSPNDFCSKGERRTDE